MIGVLLVAHDALAEGMANGVVHVLGSHVPEFACVAVHRSETLAAVRAKVEKAIARMGDAHGILILTDIYGGTPTNACLPVLISGRVELVTGVNLPMLLRVLTRRSEDLDRAIADAVTGARDGVVRASELKNMHSGE